MSSCRFVWSVTWENRSFLPQGEKNFNFFLTLTHPGAIISLALRRYLSWIEGLTTNQNVIGSNPIRRTSRT